MKAISKFYYKHQLAIFKGLCKLVLIVGIAGSLVLVEVITYRETVSWLSDSVLSAIQEDNSDFLSSIR